MAIVTPRTVVIRIKSTFNHTTLLIVRIAGVTCFFTGDGIYVLPTEFFAAFPAPGPAATRTDHKTAPTCLKPACENIVTCGVFEAPSVTPRALFGVSRHPIYRLDFILHS